MFKSSKSYLITFAALFSFSTALSQSGEIKKLVKKNDIKALENLFKKNPKEIEKLKKTNEEFLIIALNKNFKDLAKYLINNGANPNVQNLYGETALYIALEEDYLDIAELLINKGANLNVQNSYDETALQIALKYNYQDIAKLLI